MASDGVQQIPRRARLWSAVFTVVWLIPLALTGLGAWRVGQAGGFLSNMYNASCLFENRQVTWHSIHYQVQVAGDSTWITVPNDSLSAMQPFGYRSRLDRLVEESLFGQPRGERLRESVAGFVHDRYESWHPDAPPVRRVRLVLIARLTDGELLTERTHWTPADIDNTDPALYTILTVRDFATADR